MLRIRILTYLCAGALCLVFANHASGESDPNRGDEGMTSSPIHFMVHMVGTRDSWPEDMTAEEGAVMGRHFVYLQNLMFDRKVLLAGPSMGLRRGIVVLQVVDEAEARAIMDGDPSVIAGLHTYEIYEFEASLLYGRDRLASEETGRMIRKEAVVNATRDEVWRAWTTESGLTAWSAPSANIELKVGGKYEWLFAPDSAPAGTRGAEGCRVLSFMPKEMLTFSWNAPPSIPEARRYRSRVVVQFSDASSGHTSVVLTQLGFGPEPMWDEVYEYFDAAWGRVLEALQSYYATGD